MYNFLGQKEKLAEGVADYSWLVAAPMNTWYKMPQVERLELEELCSKVKPDECSRVITAFRQALCPDTPLEHISRLLRASILQVLDGRPKVDTIPEWLSKSLGNLGRMRPRSARKVTPLSELTCDDLEMQGTPETSVSTVSMSVSSTNSLPNFYVKSEHVHV